MRREQPVAECHERSSNHGGNGAGGTGERNQGAGDGDREFDRGLIRHRGERDGRANDGNDPEPGPVDTGATADARSTYPYPDSATIDGGALGAEDGQRDRSHAQLLAPDRDDRGRRDGDVDVG